MSQTISRLTAEVLALPSEQRAQLVDALLDSLNDMDPEVEASWIEECDRRMANYDAGRTKGYPAEEVFRNLSREDPN